MMASREATSGGARHADGASASDGRAPGLDRARFLETTAAVVLGAALLISAAAAYLCVREVREHGLLLACAVVLFNITTAVSIASSLRTRAGILRLSPDQAPDSGVAPNE